MANPRNLDRKLEQPTGPRRLVPKPPTEQTVDQTTTTGQPQQQPAKHHEPKPQRWT